MVGTLAIDLQWPRLVLWDRPSSEWGSMSIRSVTEMQGSFHGKTVKRTQAALSRVGVECLCAFLLY